MAAIWALAISDHAIALYIFAYLVFIDLVVKMIALSHKNLEDKHKNSDFINSIMNISEAHKDRYINSSVMKHRFSGKILAYIFIIMSAGGTDMILMSYNFPATLLYIIPPYLAFTELVSILENLQEAEADFASNILNFMNSKKKLISDFIFDRFRKF
jgi:hypothetical protein